MPMPTKSAGPKSKCLRVPRKLRFGSDFSGLDSAAFALRRAGVVVEHVFCSDIDEKCRQLLKQLHRPNTIHKDIQARTPDEEDYCDVYVTTPPCQSWSPAGLKKGLKDPRGSVLTKSLGYVKRKKPRLMLMENVRGLSFKKNRSVLKKICEALNVLGYRVHVKVLNAEDFQVAQTRARLFLVAIRKDSLREVFSWPEPTGKRKLEDDLDEPSSKDCAGRMPEHDRGKELCKLAFRSAWKNNSVDPRKMPVAVDVDCSMKWASHQINKIPTLTRSRGGSGGFWLSNRGRKMTITELMRVTGVRPSELTGYQLLVTQKQLGQMLGNSVPVPLMQAVLLNALKAAGLISSSKASCRSGPVSTRKGTKD